MGNMNYETYKTIRDHINSKGTELLINYEAYMKMIKERNNYTDEDMEDYEAFAQIELMNEEVGDLKDYDCPICKNRGYNYIFERDGKKIYYLAQSCECRKVRRVYTQLEQCGIHRNLLERYTFNKFIADNPYRILMKKRAEEFVEKAKNKDFNNWYIASGMSGTGKSHICTSIFVELIKKGKNCKYMLWKDDGEKILNLKRSFDSKEYDKRINELKVVDVLYIDDFLKLLPDSGNERNNLMDLAFTLINARASNGLITIISTEMYKEDFKDLDSAIHGRMTMMSDNKYWVQIEDLPYRDFRVEGK